MIVARGWVEVVLGHHGGPRGAEVEVARGGSCSKYSFGRSGSDALSWCKDDESMNKEEGTEAAEGEEVTSPIK